MLRHAAWGIGLFLAGCGGPDNVGRVSGKVTLNGQPLPGAVVRFEPVAGNAPSAGITNESGEYTLKYTREFAGAEIGKHTVRVSTFSGGDADADPPKPSSPEKLPAKYNAKSELTADVKSGSNTIDFPLEAAGPVSQPKAED